MKHFSGTPFKLPRNYETETLGVSLTKDFTTEWFGGFHKHFGREEPHLVARPYSIKFA
jgi:hypothetical protein